MTFTPETLTPVITAMFEEVFHTLPPDISSRLKAATKVQRHGTFPQAVFECNIWDRLQPRDVLRRNYFNYNLVYDRLHVYSSGFDWYLQWWANLTRIKHNRNEIESCLVEAMRPAPPPGFCFKMSSDGGALCWITYWDSPKSAAELVSRVQPLLRALILAMHPILIPIIDSFYSAASAAERGEIIRGKRPYVRHSDPAATKLVGDLRRNPTGSQKRTILDQHDHKCAECERALVRGQFAFHHVEHVEHGGTRVTENFIPLCKPCHVIVHRRDRLRAEQAKA